MIGLAQASREAQAADGASFLVAAPAAADEIAAGDAFNGQGGELAHNHAAQLEISIGDPPAGEFAGLVGEEVVRNQVLRLREPPVAHLGQDNPFAGDAVGQNHIERRQAITRDQQEGVTEVKNFADLSRGKQGEGHRIKTGDSGSGQGGRDFGGIHKGRSPPTHNPRGAGKSAIAEK